MSHGFWSHRGLFSPLLGARGHTQLCSSLLLAQGPHGVLGTGSRLAAPGERSPLHCTASPAPSASELALCRVRGSGLSPGTWRGADSGVLIRMLLSAHRVCPDVPSTARPLASCLSCGRKAPCTRMPVSASRRAVQRPGCCHWFTFSLNGVTSGGTQGLFWQGQGTPYSPSCARPMPWTSAGTLSGSAC